MSIEKVREYFKTRGIDGRIQEFEISSATVPLAAKALHCEESRIAKTLSFCSPFAVNEGVEVYLDISLKRFATVFPACGSSNSAIELSPQELEKYSGFIK